MPGGPTGPRLSMSNGMEVGMRTDDHPAVNEAPASALAHRFAAALAGRDAAALRCLFGSEVDFRGMTPRRVWEARTPDELIDDVILGSWFGPGDVIQRIEWVQAGQVGTRIRIGYQLRVQNAGETFALEQQAFADLTDGKITWMRVLCSGGVPVPGTGDPAAAAGPYVHADSPDVHADSPDTQLEGRRS